MLDKSLLKKTEFWNRRQFLKLGIAGGIGVAGSVIAWQYFQQRQQTKVLIPPIHSQENYGNNTINPMSMLRDFDYGTVKRENGRIIKEFRIVATNSTIQLNSTINFNTWTFNNRVPGPTLRVTEGDHVRIVFLNQGGHSHSMHFHGFHKSEMDGVKPITQGKATIYEFDAEPFGIHVYHCHTEPVARHIAKGLYGLFIIDPPNPRPAADEMVLIMGGYDINDDNKNEFYAFNGIPHYYMQNPILIYQNQLIRLYVLNMIEYDPVATFHLHANMFQVYRTGRTLKPSEDTDVITMGTAERHILEFTFKYPGKYMFHPHQDYMVESGCMGQFEVISNNKS